MMGVYRGLFKVLFLNRSALRKSLYKWEASTVCFVDSLQRNLFMVFLKTVKIDRGMSSAWRHNLNIHHSKETIISVLQMSIREWSVKLRFIEITGWKQTSLVRRFQKEVTPMSPDLDQVHRFPNAHSTGLHAVVSKLKTAGPSVYSETKTTLE